ncbi:MAG: universal stress protein [Deltaproteobacteria bacterium]|nr:universal stress protein [Deltaproteobacteria bacterium]
MEDPMQVELNYRKILVPIDFSDTSRKAFYVALKYAKVFDAETHVLHVLEPLDTFDSPEKVEAHSNEVTRVEDGVRRRVNELFERAGLAEVDRRKVHVSIRGGKPWREILEFANEKQVDLIVVGSHGQTSFKELLIGSTTERVVRKASCHVLCVKPDDYEYGPIGIPEKYKNV